MKIPHYLDTLRLEFPGKSELDLELVCAADPGLQRLTGLSEHEHRMNYLRLLWPKRVEHEWRRKLFDAYYRVKRDRRKELSLLGSSNSNKTGGLADLALGVWFEAPHVTSIYITSPYEDATETGIFARIIEQFDAALALHPHLPGKLKESENMIVMFDRNPLSFIKVVTVDQIGKMVGKKSSVFDEGQMIIICDEAPEFKRGGGPLLSVLKNLRSVPNMMLISAGNFADVNDMLGVLAEPAIEGGYEMLNVDDDQEWDTSRGGIAIRFDGHQSPNVKAGKDFLPFVTTIEYLDDLKTIEHGDRTPGYYRYGRSFPMLDFNEFTVTNAVKVKAGGCYEKVTWTSGEQHVGAHCDPGFGGDPCVFQVYRVGKGYVEGEEMDVFDLTEPPIVIPVEVAKRDEEGKDTTIDTQIAVKCKALLEKFGIPHDWFSFDDSMRGGIVQAMMRVIGPRVVAISSGGPATSRKLSAVKQKMDAGEKDATKQKIRKAKDEFANYATEMHFAVASAIDSGQIRGLQLNKAAVKQLCSRKWRWQGKKKEIEPKVSREVGAKEAKWGYKSHAGKSPNESDALVGGLENARRKGFILAGTVTSTGGALALLNGIRRDAEWKNITAELTTGTRLPSGQLHSTDPDRDKSRASLEY